MGLFFTLKRNSRLTLKGNRGRAVIILLITAGVMILITAIRQAALYFFVIPPFSDNPTMEPKSLESIISSFMLSPLEWIILAGSSVLSLLLLSPLALGVLRWHFNIVYGKNFHITEIFHFFETGRLYCRALWYDINLSVRCSLWAILFYMAPSSILGISIYFLSSKAGELGRSASAVASSGIFLAAVLFLLAGVFYAACIFRYILAGYLLNENDDVTVRDVIKTSVQYTKGFRFSLLWFSLSFIGWALLCVLAFPVIFYFVPYYNTALAMYARYIIEKNRYAPPDSTKEFSALEQPESH